MKYILIILLSLPAISKGQSYTLRSVIPYVVGTDSIFAKTGTDSLYRHVGNNYIFVGKKKADYILYSNIMNPPVLPTNTNQLTNGNGYITVVPPQTWLSITGKPTTLLGYGITDAYPLAGNPSNFLTAVPAQTFASLTGKPTTLSGYGITDAEPTITTLSFAKGGIGAASVMVGTTGTISQPMTSEILTCTPTGAMTINVTGGVAGQRITFKFTTAGVSSFVITFGTNMVKTATLATGTTSGKIFCVSWVYDGTSWLETGRTSAM